MNYIFVLLITLFIFGGCSAPIPEPIAIKASEKRIDYLSMVKPILDKRCVVCHSCYNSPCQLKLSSIEGINRGSTKALVYDGARLSATDPTRLFIDASSTGQWRNKGFTSVLQNSAEPGANNSILMHLIAHKMQHPEVIGKYAPESEDTLCPRDRQELADYLDDDKNKGMPYGFPALKEREYTTIAQWLDQGALGLTDAQKKPVYEPSKELLEPIKTWEAFFNAADIKHQMSARYLYEHLYLAHLYFSNKNDEFFELVRSSTPPGSPIKVIPTLRPYDDPEVARVYYRFRKIHSTIVHKTHMTFELNSEVLHSFQKLFIDTKWVETPHLMAYDNKTAANPFVTFAQIPPRSRYQFLLNHSEYVVRTFIRGPVCKGQIALNVIHDHFWVMFLNPDSDKTILDNGFLSSQYENLRIPDEKGSSSSLYRVIGNRYTKRLKAFYEAKQQLYKNTSAKFEDLWGGNKDSDAPILTVYRHFDSASVHRGVLGNLPRTMWVLDYSHFERIYYALVAGFDVYGNVAHQLEVRLYMDGLRVEGEENFLRFMPKQKRKSMMASWYNGADNIPLDFNAVDAQTAIHYETSSPKRELVENFVEHYLPKSLKIGFDNNYFKEGEPLPDLPKRYETINDYIQGFQAISLPGTNFIKLVNGFGSNLAHLRIRRHDKPDIFVSMVINRWHNNVAYLIGEEDQLDPNKDSINFIKGLIGSYPNYYFDVDENDLPEFFEFVKNYEETPYYFKKFMKFGIARNSPKFWETYDVFQKEFYKENPIEAGLFDLNRYYYKAWGSKPFEAD